MAQDRTQSLGETLVAQGHLLPERLEEALKEQQRTGQKLGQILLSNHQVSESQIAQVLAQQQGLPFVDLAKTPVSPELGRILGEMQTRKYRAVVLEDRQDTYLIALSDPTNLSAQLQRPINIAVVASDQLNALIDRLYSKDQQLAEFALAIETEILKEANAGKGGQITATLDDSETPVMRLLQSIFHDALQLRASDIHIEPQEKKIVVRFRIDGVLHTQVEADLKVALPLIVKLKLMAGLDIAEKRLPQDGRISNKVAFNQLDIRMSTLPTQFGESVVLRILVSTQGSKDLQALGMPEHLLKRFRAAIAKPSGIVLSTGPTGSGKTTTLYGALNQLNSPEVKILTCEDPVEYRIAGINQVQANEKIGLTFPKVLRSFLRQDPDILVVGEIRDNETAEIATRAAMTGHLVLSTLHTNDAASTPSRLMDMGVPGFMIATTLRAVLSQRLLRLVCTECAVPDVLGGPQAEWVARYFGAVPASAKLQRGAGCPHCNHAGYRGRIGLFELLEMTQALAQALHQEDPVAFETVARQQIGQDSLMHNGFALAFQGRTTVSEVIKNALFND